MLTEMPVQFWVYEEDYETKYQTLWYPNKENTC